MNPLYYAPRIRDFHTLHFYYVDQKDKRRFPNLAALYKGGISWRKVEAHWPLVRAYATAIDQRSAAPSLLLRKLEALGPTSPLHGALEQIGNPSSSPFSASAMPVIRCCAPAST